MNPNIDAVGPGFFSTMGQPLIVGREFTVKDARRRAEGRDRQRDDGEVLSSATSSPIGRRIGWARDKTPDIEIVGVVKDAKTSTLRDEPTRYVYTPYTQESELGSMTFYVRAPRRRRRRSARRCARSRCASTRTCRSST